MDLGSTEKTTCAATKKRHDVAIIGGGMVGATLALLLSKALPDCTIAIIEAKGIPATENIEEIKAQVGSFDARSTALSPSSVSVFKSLGLWEDLAPFATAINRIHVSDRSHVGLTSFDQNDNDGEALGQVVENKGLGHALFLAIAKCTNITVFPEQSISRVLPLASGAKLLDSQGSDFLMVELAVIADGANSPLRASLGIQAKTKDYKQHALVTNVAHSEKHGGRAYERFTENGPLALLPLGSDKTEHQSTLIWTFPQDEIEEALAWSDETFLKQLQDRFGYRLGNFTRVSKRFNYPLKLILAEEQVRSSIALMGNAAHFLHPVAGQGFNLSLRDNLKLVESLKQAKSSGKALGDLVSLKQYEDAQARDQQRTIFLSDSFNSVFTQREGAVITARNLGILSVELSDFVRTQFIDVLSGKASRQATF